MKIPNLVSVFLVFAAAAGLSGCNETSNRDPNVGYVKYEIAVDGCNVKYVDNPRGANFFVAKCPAESTTVTHQQQNGKSTTTIPVVTTKEVEDLEKKLADAKAKQSALDKLSPEDKKALGIK